MTENNPTPPEHKQDYYSLKRRAKAMILKAISFLELNHDKHIEIATLTIEFQKHFGFGEKTVLKLLEPHVTKKQITLVNDTIQATMRPA